MTWYKLQTNFRSLFSSSCLLDFSSLYFWQLVHPSRSVFLSLATHHANAILTLWSLHQFKVTMLYSSSLCVLSWHFTLSFTWLLHTSHLWPYSMLFDLWPITSYKEILFFISRSILLTHQLELIWENDIASPPILFLLEALRWVLLYFPRIGWHKTLWYQLIILIILLDHKNQCNKLIVIDLANLLTFQIM